MEKGQTELIFVYNADSGKWNGYLDIMHKVLSPRTYSCHLCAITYSTFTMKNEWRKFIDSLLIPVRFLHRDEWQNEFKRKDELPAVFLLQNNIPSVWIDATTLKDLELNELKQHIITRLPEII